MTSDTSYGRRISGSVLTVLILVPDAIPLFVLSRLAKAMLPSVVNHLSVARWATCWSAVYIFVVVALFMLLLVETDRLPIISRTPVGRLTSPHGKPSV